MLTHSGAERILWKKGNKDHVKQKVQGEQKKIKDGDSQKERGIVHSEEFKQDLLSESDFFIIPITATTLNFIT